MFPVGGVARGFFCNSSFSFFLFFFFSFSSPPFPPFPPLYHVDVDLLPFFVRQISKTVKLAKVDFSSLHNPVTSVDKHASIYKSIHHIYSASKRSEDFFSYMRRSFLSR